MLLPVFANQVGSVISSRQFTPDKLAAHDGRDQDKPILLAVRGLVFDVSKGRDFYGPDGAYPFSGKEVARALAKTSLDPKVFLLLPVPCPQCGLIAASSTFCLVSQIRFADSSRLGANYCLWIFAVIARCFSTQDFNADLEGLSQTEIKTLSDWEIKFRRKYKIVGSMAPN